uniref:Ubiquitinyl hydrolase 1 n=1 Tax=Mucochytrium quahogii TaxID=96639 RepID=A0A7S2RE64_9STRA|mmetsp:Transcript_12006/g.22157  ORF Transcript_12006/g.22157 Transcript_12006/m.22157 type:complete len:2389 (+) Transcript_12006:175-7341(+)|eukprot:CAMPEP_0203744792 /NCGR_PEP_ID=MMETSP0098-20131031/750_1 /ASSEMBLY_ACC=CAM_ASM_000208 /TAXON_ID=96639 /ORGANISM=" , Strain NY0313808BC1" /LENGTH=2388 /DNA_ID=CAMNT_0050632413 /DNA_START=128 /DNA_END=7294 /DNA_ORIENTATION=+
MGCQWLPAVDTVLEALCSGDVNLLRESLDGLRKVVGAQTTAVARVSLYVACSPDLGQASGILLANVMVEMKMYNYLLLLLRSFAVARRFDILDSIAMNMTEGLLHSGFDDNQEKKAVVDWLLLGFQHSPKLAAKVAPLLVGEMEDSMFARLVASKEWVHASAVRKSINEGADFPVENAELLDKMLRQTSWVRNDMSSLPFIPPNRLDRDFGHIPINSFSFTYPYFPWPEGTWVLQPQPGQGEKPHFSLSAKERGVGGTLIGRIVSGIFTNYEVQGNYLCIHGKSVRMQTMAKDSGSPGKNSVPLKMTCEITSNKRQLGLFGVTGRGSQTNGFLGVRRVVRVGDLTIDNIPRAFSDNKHACLEISAQQAIVVPGVVLSFQSSWTVQFWLYRPSVSKHSEDWATLVQLHPLRLEIRETPNTIELRLLCVQRGEIAQVLIFEAGCAAFESEWFHISLSGSSQHDIRCCLNGNRIVELAVCEKDVSELGFVSLGTCLKRKQSLIVCGLKLWRSVRNQNEILQEFSRGFSLSCELHTGLLGWYPMQGSPVLCLCNVTSNKNHLQVVGKQYLNGIELQGAQTTMDTSCQTLPTLAETEQLVIVGPFSSDGIQLYLDEKSSIWTKERIPIAGGFSAKYVLSLSTGDTMSIQLHGGSFWEMIGSAYHGCPNTASNQVQVVFKLTEKNGVTGFEISVYVNDPSPLRLLCLPLAGRMTGVSTMFEVTYDRNARELQVSCGNVPLVALHADILKYAGVHLIDGVFIGACAIKGKLQCTGLQVGGEARELPVEPLTSMGVQAGSDSAAMNAPSLAPENNGSVSQPLTWACPLCTVINPSSALFCETCSTANPNTALVPAVTPLDCWVCQSCTFVNNLKAPTCEICHTPNPNQQESKSEAIDLSQSTWACPQCTYANPGTAVRCSICESERPRAVSTNPAANVDSAANPAEHDSKNDVEDVIKQRVFNLSQATEMLNQDDMEGTTNPDWIFGSWDTTHGQMDLQMQESEQETCFGLALEGEYGENEGTIDAIALYVSRPNDKTWAILGTWGNTTGARKGLHGLNLRLGEAGETLNGTWCYGDSVSGTWSASLRPDPSYFRGLTQGQKVRPVVTSLQEQVAQYEQEKSVKNISDPSLAFRPRYTGLANMEQGLTNVCYQNSLLQALFLTYSFRYKLLFPPPGCTSGNELFSTLQALMGRLLLSDRPVLVTKELQSALRSDWKTGEQMDVSDFNDYLMLSLSESLPEGVLEGIFGCQTAHLLRCTSCGKTKENRESALGLAVTLPRQYMPITDITAVTCPSKSELSKLVIPEGFERIRVNINADKDDAPCVYLCVKREPNEKPITELMIRVLSGASSPPTAPNNYKLVPVNLNPGKRDNNNPANVPDGVYLFFQRDIHGSPITEVRFLVGDDDVPPEGFRVISTDLNPSWASRDGSVVPVSGGSTGMLQQPAKPPAVPKGPSTTSVKLCYKRGMPVTDIVVSSSPPKHNEADYQVIDKALNFALEGDNSPSDVFLWYTDSNVFCSPLTELVLVDKEKADFNNYELCGDVVFCGGRVLLKRRGEGCPITQVDVFRAPKLTPPFRFHSIINVTTRPESCEVENIISAPWIPRMEPGSKVSSASSGRASPSGPSGQQSGAGTASGASSAAQLGGILASRGKSLHFEVVDRNIAGWVMHGRYVDSGPDSSSRVSGAIYGVIYQLQQSRWTFVGYRTNATNGTKEGCWDLVQFEVTRPGNNLNGYVLDSSNAVLGVKPPEHIQLDAEKTSSSAGVSCPIVDIRVIRGEDDIPMGYEFVESVGSQNPQHRDINFGTGSRPAYIVVRRGQSGQGSAQENEEMPIVQVGVVMSELEELPDGYETIVSTPSGESADLNLGAEGLPMYLCFRRQDPKGKREEILFNLALHWQDLGDTVPAGYDLIKWTIKRLTEANLCLTGKHKLFLCTETRPQSMGIVSHEVNGTYRGGTLQMELYAVTNEVQGHVVNGIFHSLSAYDSGHTKNNRTQIDGYMFNLEDLRDEEFRRLFPDVAPSSDAKKFHNTWCLCGIWLNEASGGNSNPLVTPAIWKFSRNDVCDQIEGTWSWGKTTGKVTFLQDTFLQISGTSDSSELWKDGSQLFSDRCVTNDIQALVKHSFSSSVLDGVDMPVCDDESVKRTHKQYTIMTEPPEHLALTVKRMGFDFKKHKPIKHLETTRFQPVLELPQAKLNEETSMEQHEQTNWQYGLYSIVVHTGSNANSGHYFTYGRHSSDQNLHLYDSPTSPWVLFNDSRVASVTWKEMTAQIESSESNTVYLLFYRKLQALASRQTENTQHPAKKARTGYQEDEMADEDELVQAILLSQGETENVSPDVVRDKEELKKQQSNILHRISVYQKYTPPHLQKIVNENSRFLLEDMLGKTSPIYRELLSAQAKI